MKRKLYDSSVNFFTHLTSEEAGLPLGQPSVLVEVTEGVAVDLHQEADLVAGLLRGLAGASEGEPSGS